MRHAYLPIGFYRSKLYPIELSKYFTIDVYKTIEESLLCYMDDDFVPLSKAVDQSIFSNIL